MSPVCKNTTSVCNSVTSICTYMTFICNNVTYLFKNIAYLGNNVHVPSPVIFLLTVPRLLLLLILFIICVSCSPLSYCLVFYLQHCGHILEKGWPFVSFVCYVFLCFCHFHIMCTVSGEVLDCIDCLSLPSSLLVLLYKNVACKIEPFPYKNVTSLYTNVTTICKNVASLCKDLTSLCKNVTPLSGMWHLCVRNAHALM